MVIAFDSVLVWDTRTRVLSATCVDRMEWTKVYDKLAEVNHCRWAIGADVPFEHACLPSGYHPRYRGRYVKTVKIDMPRTPHSYFGEIIINRWLYKAHVARSRTMVADCDPKLRPLLELLCGLLGALAGIACDLRANW